MKPLLTHRGGIPWNLARIPRRWHLCRWQTRGEAWGVTSWRCACGATRHALWYRHRNTRPHPFPRGGLPT